MKSRILAAVGTKGAAGLAVAALTLGGGAVVAMAATGSANPAAWGQKVAEQVEACKAQAVKGEQARDTAASSGRTNVGRCVSAFARQHGEAQQAKHGNTHDTDHPASPSPAAGKPTGAGSTAHGQSDQTHGSSSQTHGDSSHAHTPSPSPRG